MVRRSLTLLAVAAILLSGGCLQSIHSLRDESSTKFKPELLGAWNTKGDQWTFTRADNKAYQLEVRDGKGDRSEHTAHLVDLDGKLYLEVSPLAKTERAPSDGLYIATHMIFRVDDLGEKLTLGVMDMARLKRELEADPKRIAHVMLDKRPILTAPTAEVRKFVAASQEMFNPSVEFTRVQ